MAEFSSRVTGASGLFWLSVAFDTDYDARSCSEEFCGPECQYITDQSKPVCERCAMCKLIFGSGYTEEVPVDAEVGFQVTCSDGIFWYDCH